ncbi:MAG TPA: dUTP diphosphatase [Candidatus Paceibacterota bacterium]|nr:dUTP diphosphatase [Candidatus Paceibacterota bacterium]
MILKIKKLTSDAKLPSYAHHGDAGLDLYSAEDKIIKPNERAVIKTGLAMELPHGHAGLVWDKSGLAAKNGLKVLGGVVDCNYRGEVMVLIMNLSNKDYEAKKGEKIAQMLIQKVEHMEIEEVKELSDTTRGAGGFGSTGKK